VTSPWDFQEAKVALHRASQLQLEAQSEFGEVMQAAAEAEAAYRVALAKEEARLRADGMPVTLIPDLARGCEPVAQLKLERDVAAGLVEANKANQWRLNQSHKAALELAHWSLAVSTGRAAD
jgi:hypothetical protein